MGVVARVRRLFEQVPRVWRGVLGMLVVTLLFSMQQALVKHISAEMHPLQIGFFRQFFGFLVLVPVIARTGLAAFAPRRLGLYSARAVLEVTSMSLNFAALSITTLGTVVALFFTTPLFATLFAVIILRESFRLSRAVGLGVGFIGSLIVLRPGIIEIDLGALLMLGSVALWGASISVIKILSRTESNVKMTVYMAAMATPLALIAALPVWRMPTLYELAVMALVGGISSLAHIMFVQVFRNADVTAVMPLDFLRLLWAALIGYIAFNEFPDLWTWIGATTIFVAATSVALHERRNEPPARPPT